jgi:hypothetical protein
VSPGSALIEVNTQESRCCLLHLQRPASHWTMATDAWHDLGGGHGRLSLSCLRLERKGFRSQPSLSAPNISKLHASSTHTLTLLLARVKF